MNMIRKILIVEPDPKTAQELFLLFHSGYGRFGRERCEPEIAESVAQAAETGANYKLSLRHHGCGGARDEEL